MPPNEELVNGDIGSDVADSNKSEGELPLNLAEQCTHFFVVNSAAEKVAEGTGSAGAGIGAKELTDKKKELDKEKVMTKHTAQEKVTYSQSRNYSGQTNPSTLFHIGSRPTLSRRIHLTQRLSLRPLIHLNISRRIQLRN
jgi:hypothetical protein